MPEPEVNWDVFISHARADAETIARPLKESLQAAGLRTWLDSEQLLPGDSLRGGIDRGLAQSRFAVVILSQAFFAREWPQRELNGLAVLESADRKVILPVWHDISQAEIARHSPMLADRVGISTADGIEAVARRLLQTIAAPSRNAASAHGAEDLKAESAALENLSLADPPGLTGQYVGSYRLERFIGKGGTGVVFCAKQPATGREVALKLFYPLPSAFEQFRVLFHKAFRAVAALDHPHIARVFDVNELRVNGLDSFYLVMEYIEGLQLRDWSLRLGADATAFAKRLDAAIQLTGALQAAHGTSYLDEFGLQIRGVLHGDIKPSNVLVTGGDQVKLLDFLLLDVQQLQTVRKPARNARPKRHRESLEEETTYGFGTVGFMPPEQMEKGQLTVQSDVYALGVTLCHLFCPTDPEFRLGHTAASELPQRLTTLLSSMLAPNAQGRPAGTEQVMAVLEELKNPGTWKAGWWRRLFGRFAS